MLKGTISLKDGQNELFSHYATVCQKKKKTIADIIMIYMIVIK